MNKRKLFISLAIALIVIVVSYIFSKKLFALDNLQSHRPVYFLAGNSENQVKFQVSFKYILFMPFSEGLSFGYTQLNHWNLYDQSSPFKETNYNPELFYQKDNPLEFFDFVRLGFYSHTSNGRDKAESRSVDKSYIESQLSYGMKYEIGIREKVAIFYNVSNKNKDIKRYQGNFETEIFFQAKTKQGYIGHERIYAKGEWTHRFYWFETGLNFRLFTPNIQPNIYIQWFYGYSEFLLDYNKKTNALRAGFIFNPNGK